MDDLAAEPPPGPPSHEEIDKALAAASPSAHLRPVAIGTPATRRSRAGAGKTMRRPRRPILNSANSSTSSTSATSPTSRRQLPTMRPSVQQAVPPTWAVDLVPSMCHDLRNPLAAIALGSELLGRRGLTTEQRHVVDHIAGAALRANQLVGHLLDLAHAASGAPLALWPAPLDLHRLTAQAVGELGAAHPGRVIEHDRLGEGLCVGDARRITQVISELVSNAVCHGAPDRRIVVTSSIRASEFFLLVHNWGEPVGTLLEPTLFTVQRKAGVSASGRSLRCGLFMVRRIARAHGGDATLESSSAHGTVVMARFRIAS